MTLIRKLVLVLCLAPLFSNYSNSQTIDYTTGNLIINNNWSGVGAYAPAQAGMLSNPAGSAPLYDTATDTIRFSYGQATVKQSIAVNQALATAGSGIQVNGYSWGYDVRNMNYDNRQGSVDTLNVVSYLNSSTGSTVASASQIHNTKFEWTNFSGTQILSASAVTSSLSSVGISFSGRDTGYWGGLFGPEVRNVSLKLNYGVDPCATNPAYSTNCAGFSSVLTSSNLVPNPNAYAVGWYNPVLDNSFAIQTALKHSGTGMTVHGFNYGYQVWASPSNCGFDLFLCWDTMPGGMAQVNASITGANGQQLHSSSRAYNGTGYVQENFQYRLPSSLNQFDLGNFNFTAYTAGDAWVGGMYSNMVYTQDPCYSNSSYSTLCTNKPLPVAALPPPTVTTVSYGAVSSDIGGMQLSTDGIVSSPSPVPVAAAPPPAAAEPPPGNMPAAGSPAQASSSMAAGSPVAAPGAPPAIAGSPANQTSPVTVGGAPNAKAGPNMSLIMSTISNIQAADKATQNAAVANAQQVVSTSSAAAQAQAFQVVDQLNTMSSASAQANQMQASSGTTFQQQQANGSATVLQGPTVLSAQTLSAMAAQSSQTATQSQGSQSSYSSSSSASTYSLTSNTTGRTSFGISINTQTASPIQAMITPQATIQMEMQRFDTRAVEQDVPVMQASPATARGSVLNDLLEARTNFNSMQIEQKDSTVKKNVQANELAGGVDVASIAQVPKGYEVYSLVTLRDAPFYKPEAIYKDNRTVDNARLLKGLTGGSDARHQQMIDSQYKLGE